jgi:hypothetical protein
MRGLCSCLLLLAAAPAFADGVRVVPLGAPPLEVRVPEDLKELERRSDLLRFGGGGGSVIADIVPAGDLIDLRALRELAAASARRPKTRVVEQALVEINGRPAAKLVTEEGGGSARSLQYLCFIDLDHEARIIYVLPPSRFEVLRRELEKIESPTNRFAKIEHARGLTPDGAIGFPRVPIPARWRVIGSDGKLLELPNPQHADLVYVTVAGAQIVANTAPEGRGEALETSLLPDGPIDGAFVERQLARFRDQFGTVEVLQKRALRLTISDSPAQKLVLAVKDHQSGHPMLELIYFATDELSRNWALRYVLRREHVANWRARFEEIESRVP